MKTTKQTLVILLAAMSTLTGVCQNDITLNIHHKLNAKNFEFGHAENTSLDQSVEFDRMEYYVSNISITHDGGTVTAIDSVWILARANNNTSKNLGSYDINEVESISFYVGVDSAENHDDPSGWSLGHPLSPQSPSMHWGWAAGYRFAALEGSSDNANFEIHALGDVNYFQTSVDISAVAEDGELNIDLYANYVEALRDIDVSSGLIMHGETDESITCLENFRDYVFSATEMVDTSDANGIAQTHLTTAFDVYPNPVADGWANVSFGSDINVIEAIQLVVYDLTGKSILRFTGDQVGQRLDFSSLDRGIYLLRLETTGKADQASARRLVIQ